MLNLFFVYIFAIDISTVANMVWLWREKQIKQIQKLNM